MQNDKFTVLSYDEPATLETETTRFFFFEWRPGINELIGLH